MADSLTFQQIKAAMEAMIAKGTRTPDEPVAMAIVDDTGNLRAYASMDNLRLFSRRHAVRKAYTAAVLATDSGANPGPMPNACTARAGASASWETLS